MSSSSEIPPVWRYFLNLISENKFEKTMLEKILLLQFKKVENYNKLIKDRITKFSEKAIVIDNEIIKLDFQKLAQDLGKTSVQKLDQIVKEKEEAELKKKESLVQDPTKNLDPIKDKFCYRPSKSKDKKDELKAIILQKQQAKFVRYLNEDGVYFKNDEELGSFFEDLNFGDLAIKFHNFDGEIGPGMKFSYISVVKAFEFFQKYLGLKTDLKEITKEFVKTEYLAFLNALIFYSNFFYCKNSSEGTIIGMEENKGWIEIDNKFSYFNSEISKWIIEEESDFKKVANSKIAYKQKMLIKFLSCLITNDLGFYFAPSKVSRAAHKMKSKGKKVKSRIKESNLLKFFQLKLVENNSRNLALFDEKKMTLLNQHYKILLRKSLQIRFEKMGLWTRSFFSSNFNFIYLVIKAQSFTILERAQMEGVPKQFELGFIDLLSFEPLDNFNRPFRIKRLEFQEFQNQKKKLEKQQFEMFLANGKEKFEGIRVSGGDPHSLIRTLKNFEEYTIYDLYKFMPVRMIQFKKALKGLMKHSQKKISNSRIIDDNIVGKNEWNSFMLYTLMLEYLYKGVRKVSNYEIFEKYKGLIHRLIMMKSLKDTNRAISKKNFFNTGKPLNTLWDKLGLDDPYFPWGTFSNSSELSQYWRTYETNELGHRSIFTQTDTVKILFNFISKAILIDDLLKEGTILDYFPLHDNYILKGESKLPLFINILDIGKLVNATSSPQEHEIQKLLEILKDQADASDFFEQSLTKDAAFRFLSPMNINITALVDYFGEKVGLFFHFLVFYARGKGLMSLIGLGVFVAQNVLISANQIFAYKIVTLAFAALVILWSVLFLELWKREQKLFSVKFGQLLLSDNEKESRLRSGYHGTYIRDISSNNQNKIYYSGFRRGLILAFTIIVSLIIVAISIGVTLALLLWKKNIDPTDFWLNQLVVFINTIQILIFNLIYKSLAPKFTDMENHSTLEKYENSMIFKQFIFSFANTFNSMFLIAFVKPYVDIFGICVNRGVSSLVGVDCFVELSYQVRFVFIIDFFLAFLRIIIPFVKGKFIQLIFNKKIPTKEYPWKLIDKEIEFQAAKDTFRTVPQIDGTMLEYLRIFLQFTFITLFSISFPLTFPMAFIGGILDIHVDKTRLFYFYKRPLPLDASSIGLWEKIFEFIIYLSIIVNAFLFSFTLNGWEDVEIPTARKRLTILLVIILIAVSFKLLLQVLLSGVPGKFIEIIKRHKVLEAGLKTSHTLSTQATVRAGVFLNVSLENEEFFNDPNYLKEIKR